jgi:pimeloyl-ACP methyl ester carboxylesterase
MLRRLSPVATLACLSILIPLLFPGTAVEAQPAVAQLPAGPFAAVPDQFLNANGVTLRYKEVGRGDAVVLIHGYTATLESLSGVAERLATTHHVIAFDVRGFGKSSKFADAARFGQHMVDDVARLLDHLKIERAHLVGHSMGALIAANVAARYPGKVSSASLIAGPFYPDKKTFAAEASRWTADLQSGTGLTNFLQWLFPTMKPPMAAGMNAQVLKANDMASLIAVMQSLPELAISGLRVPGLASMVAAGAADPLHPLSIRFAKASVNARLLDVKDADHVTVIGRPELVQAMSELLKQATNRSQARELAGASQ